MHPLVEHLHFSRAEFVRCLQGVTAEEGQQRLGQMNSISWMVGHLADQENRYWVRWGQDKVLFPELNQLVGFGKPASTPPLDEMWAIWREVTAAADDYLLTLTPDVMQTFFLREGKPLWESIGTLLWRNVHHYWFHTGEAHAVRQLLGHKELPQFVGDMSAAAYRPE